VPLRRLLAFAECLSDNAIFLGLVDRKTFGSRSRALLRCVTLADHRRPFKDFFAAFFMLILIIRDSRGHPRSNRRRLAFCCCRQSIAACFYKRNAFRNVAGLVRLPRIGGYDASRVRDDQVLLALSPGASR
jgi:hypothetical protein